MNRWRLRSLPAADPATAAGHPVPALPGRRLARAAAVALAAMAALAVARRSAAVEPSITVSGMAEASYVTGGAVRDGRLVGRVFGGRENEFSIDFVQIGLDRALPTSERGAGFSARLNLGPNARPLRAAGLELGRDVDLTSAFVSVGTPGRGGRWIASFGRFASLLGVEVVESPLNPDVSPGYPFIFVEDFSSVGVDVQWLAASGWSARMRVTNGWDVLEDPNRAKTVFARADYPLGAGSAGLAGYWGPETPGNDRSGRGGVEAMVSGAVRTARWQVQLDAGRDDGPDASWRSASTWVTLPLRGESTTLALRADLLDDEGGARTSGALGFPVHGGQRVGSLTATLGVRVPGGVWIRPEARWDRSSLAAFDGGHDQWSVGMAVAFVD